jgi:hypothetical protein
MGNGAAREATLREERELDTINRYDSSLFFLQYLGFIKSLRTQQLNADIDKLKRYYLGMMTDTAQFTVNNLDRSEIDKIRIGLFGPTGMFLLLLPSMLL